MSNTTPLPPDLRPLLLTGHVLDRLRDLPADSVQCCVTSPPYWGLRSYGTDPQTWGGVVGHVHTWETTPPRRPRSIDDAGYGDAGKYHLAGGGSFDAQGGRSCSCGAWLGELGSEPTPELYVQHLADVFDEVRRVLRPDGTLWLNLGDTYTTHPAGLTGAKRWKASTLANRDNTGAEQAGAFDKRTDGGLPEKNLVGIPWRVAFELQRRGWFLRSEIIWFKRNPMPESVTDRPGRAHEQIFQLTKESRYYYDQDAMRQPFSEVSIERAKSHFPSEAEKSPSDSKWETGRRRFPLLQSVARATGGYSPSTLKEVLEGYDGKATKAYDGTGAQDPSAVKARIIAGIRKKQDALGKRTYTGFNERYDAAPPVLGANLKSVWDIPTEPFPGAHFATFPKEIPRRAILLGTSEKGACAKCGKPWKRDVDEPPTHGPSERDYKSDAGYRGKHSFDSGKEWSEWLEKYPRTTTGWSPSCRCADPGPPVPCVVLDPFSGSGTTCEVARSLGRRSIGIDLNAKYVELARKRAGQLADLTSYPDASVIPALPSQARPGGGMEQPKAIAADEGAGNQSDDAPASEAGP